MSLQSIHDWLHANSDNNLFGVIVGGVIGIVGGFIVPLVGSFEKWLTGRREVKARLVALAVELDYLREVTIEIREMLAKNLICSKRLNVDLLESVRLTAFELATDEHFIKGLAQVYRDVVHTNDRLDDILADPGPMVQRIHDVQAFIAHERSIRAAVARLSLDGVERSIESLRDKIHVKTMAKFERTKAPVIPPETLGASTASA